MPCAPRKWQSLPQPSWVSRASRFRPSGDLMYNRYVPQQDGTFRRCSVQETVPPHRPSPQPTPQTPCVSPIPSPQPPPKPAVCPKERCHHSKPEPRPQDAGSFLRRLLPKDFDTGDLMIILLLLLMAGDCQEDQNTALLTLALYLFL